MLHPERPFQVVDDEGRNKGRYWAERDAIYVAAALYGATLRPHYVLRVHHERKAADDGFWTNERLQVWRTLTMETA